MHEREQIVVTGLGAITPIGLDAATFWQNLTAGVSGAARITSFDPSNLPVQIAAEVKDFDPAQWLDAKEARRMARFSQFGAAAAQQAVTDAGLVIDDSNRHRIGVAVATGGGGVIDTATETQALLEKGPRRVGAFFVPTMAANMAACQVAITQGTRGPTLAAVAACAAGLYSFAEAIQLIQSGRVDVVLAGGTEAAVHPLSIAAMANMRALSRRNDEPEKASRPFDLDRDGFLFGEGAAIMVIESAKHAEARGARVYAELAGSGMSSDAFHITAPREDGSGAAEAMEWALKDSGMAPCDVDYIAAHGTATPAGDVSESRAIRLAYGDHADRLAISSPKSMVGHLLGAAGAIGALTALMAVHHDVVPPTINLDTPDPECDLDYVPNVARSQPVRAAAANGFGFGGQNASVIFRDYVPR